MAQQFILWLMSFEWHGNACLVWTAWGYDALQLILATIFSACTILALLPQGKRIIDRLMALESAPKNIVIAMRFLLAGWFVFILFMRVVQYLTMHYIAEVPMFLNMIWNTNRHQFLPSWTIENLSSILKHHFFPILAVYCPIAWAFRSPLLTILIFTCFIFSSVIVFWYLCHEIKLHWGLCYLLCAMYLTNPYTSWIVGNPFQTEPHYLPIFFLVLLAWEKRAWTFFILSVLVMFGIKEETGVALASLGIASLVVPGRRKEGLLLTTVSLIGLVLTLHFMKTLPGDSVPVLDQLFGKGDNLSEVVKYYLHRPGEALLTWGWPLQKFGPISRLIITTGGLAIAYPPALIALLLLNAPHQAAWLRYPYFDNLTYHYSAIFIPLLFWGSAHGLRKIFQKGYVRQNYLVALLLVCLTYGSLCLPQYVSKRRVSSARLAAAWSAFAALKPNDAVWTSTTLAGPIAFRQQLRDYAVPGSRFFMPDVILINVQDYQTERTAFLNLFQFAKKHRFVIDREDHGVLLLRQQKSALNAQ